MTNLKLAKIYVGLDEVKSKIQNEILPLMAYLNFPDDALVGSLEYLVTKIEEHLSTYEIQAIVKPEGK